MSIAFEQVLELIENKNFLSIDQINNIQDYSGNIKLIVTDKSHNYHVIEVYYNHETNQISKPQTLFIKHLPSDVIIEIAISMDLKDVVNMCQSNSILNNILCNNKDFWIKLLQHEIGIEGIEGIIEIRKDPSYKDDLDYWKDIYKNYGKVYSFGHNDEGQLGLGDKIDRNKPELITLLDKIRVISISAGYDYSLVLDKNWRVYSFGSNYGQLGLGDQISKIKPELISSLEKIKIISISTSYHSLVLDKYGRVYSFGNNENGQLGLNDNTDRNIPTLISSLKDIKIIAISAGDSYSLVLDNEGKVYSFGGNHAGQLGLGDYGEGTERNIPELISLLEGIKIIAISAGDGNSLVLDDDGRVYSFGSNSYGQLGLGDMTDRYKPEWISSLKGIKIISISSYLHSLVLDNNSKVYSFGNNEDGQLGLGDDGEGTNRYIPNQIISLDKIKIISISAGDFHSLVLDENRRVYSFGSNLSGQLGLGDHGEGTDRNKPELISSLENKIIKSISAGNEHSLITLF